jgi:cell division protein FtsW
MNKIPKPTVSSCIKSDTLLLFAFAGLLIIGYIIMVSATMDLGFKKNENVWHFPVRQLIHISLGLIIGAIILMINVSFWQKIYPWLFLAGLALLVLVLIPGLGVKVNGSVRWLLLGGVRIQVSEIVKFTSVIYMAGYVTKYKESVRNSSHGMVKPLMLFAFCCFLLLKEPDFGSAVVILTIAFGMMFISGAKIWQFVILLVTLVILAALLVYYEPYRLTRVVSFIDPWADPLNSGFQLTQALIAFGRGEWLGVGLGSGLQKLFYLPEAHTDFLFAVLSEELGLLGVLTVICLYSLLVWRAFAIAIKAEMAELDFHAYTAYGLGIWFGFQAFVNIGVNMGMLPTKGLTLPLMSYGGGSMVIMCAAIALLFRISSEVSDVYANTPKRKPEWVIQS